MSRRSVSLHYQHVPLGLPCVLVQCFQLWHYAVMLLFSQFSRTAWQ
jgi:hypothetical protein